MRDFFLKSRVIVIIAFAVLVAFAAFTPYGFSRVSAAKCRPSKTAAVKMPKIVKLPPPKPDKLDEILAARAKNADVVGYLSVPSTTLDMPVVKYSDNAYYLKHDINKQPYYWGWPFIDCADSPEPLSRNTIIYGHNMGDGKLFAQLKQYENKDFLNRNPIIYYGTDKHDYYWKVFAVFITDTNLNYIQTDFTSNREFMDTIQLMRRQSMYGATVDVRPTDRILTFSTCTYEFKGARFVVQARLIRPGESFKVLPATPNPNQVSPHH